MIAQKREKYFMRLLKKQMEALLAKNSNPASNITETTDFPLDFTDQATLESDMDLNIHMKERDSKLLLKIREALERLEDGTYGICEECGEEISEKRLKARPVTTLCVACKRKQEAEEKTRGI